MSVDARREFALPDRDRYPWKLRIEGQREMFRNPTADLLVVLAIVLLIFGPKRLPGLGRQLGQGLREFKDSITGHDDNDDEADDRPQIARTSAEPVAEPAPREHQTADTSSYEHRA
jgi:sec-independent protein translocase protein TatA